MDKRITRMANSGATSVLMFGKSWTLTPGTWAVQVPTARRPKAERKVYKVDSAAYYHPSTVGGRCVRRCS